MTTTDFPDPDDLITRVVDAFERMPVPAAPSVRETVDMLERGQFQRPKQTVVAPDRPTVPLRRLSARQRFAGAGLAAVAAACLMVAGVWLLVPGQQPAAQAFDRFAAALVDARSATFQLEVTVAGHGTQKLQSYYLAPGKMRCEMPGVVSIADMKTGKTVNLLPEQKTALIMNIKSMPSEPDKPQFNDFFEQLRDLLSKSRSAQEDSVKQLGEKEIDGRRVIGFRCESPLESMDLWGDPATGLPVRVEAVLSGLPRIEYTMTRFFFDGDLDVALFDTTPPADYKVEVFDIDASKPTEVALVEALRMAADLNDGVFPDNLEAVLGTEAPLDPQPKQAIDEKKYGWRDMTPELLTIGRGLTFVAQLPKTAEAHYAGKGVKRDEPKRPIFWYMPEGAKTYRVIYADLSVKAAERAPELAAGLLAAEQRSTFQAFNMLAEVLLEAKSATFHEEVIVEGQEKQECLGYYLAPGKMRNELKMKGAETITIFDAKAGKMTSLYPERKTAVVVHTKDRPNERGKAEINDIFERMRNLLSESRNAQEDNFSRLGEKEIDGRRVVGFSFANAAQSLTLWGDPTTGLPVLVEMVLSGTPKSAVTMSHFELNEKLDPALFDTTPPAGYKIQAFDVDASQPTEAELIEMLRMSADLDDGRFINSLDMASIQAMMIKHVEQVHSGANDKSNGMSPEVMKQGLTIGRGMIFALFLPESADAHYAGKGVKLDEPNRPIFWYKPEGANAYRVIYADLSVKDAETAPEVAGAVRLERITPPGKKDQKHEK